MFYMFRVVFEIFKVFFVGYSQVLDVDDACVAVEGVNYERVEVCQHYINNKCWFGDECNKLHTTANNAETKSLKLVSSILMFRIISNLKTSFI